MSNAASTYRRRLGRAPSPPTWLWYEQIPYDDDDSSCSDDDDDDDDDVSVDGGDYDDDHENSCSEDDEDYSRAHGTRAERRGGAPAAPASESGSSNSESASGSDEPGEDARMAQQECVRASDGGEPKETMDVDGRNSGEHDVGAGGEAIKKDVKGKQRAVEPEVEESPRRRERRKKRQPMITLRPILTIQKSQGFVWNQDLFVPPYIKDRYVASSSPANSNSCVSMCASSYNAMQDYEVDVVEIRVKEGEYSHIIP